MVHDHIRVRTILNPKTPKVLDEERRRLNNTNTELWFLRDTKDVNSLPCLPAQGGGYTYVPMVPYFKQSTHVRQLLYICGTMGAS